METFRTAGQEENDFIAAELLAEEKPSLHCLDEALTDEEAQPEPPKKKKKGSFRMYTVQYTLTYPKCDTKKEVAVERLKQKFGDELKGYVVSEEKHKDGTNHLHAFVLFKKRKQFTKSDCFDFVAGQHGSYEVTKSVRDWVTYVTKDGAYVAEGVDVEAIRKKKGQKSDDVARMIMEGKSLEEVNKEHPGYVMINKRKLEEYESWVQCKKAMKNKEEWKPPTVEGLTDTDKQIAEWICLNIRQPRKFKSAQLMVIAPANHGKTSLVEWLERSLSVYHIPVGEDFYDLYSDEYDLAVMDEFKGQKTLQWMNMFLQGGPMNIRKKGSQYMKMKNIPVIILSNYPLHTCYPKAAEDGRLDTLRARLEIVEVDSFISFYK